MSGPPLQGRAAFVISQLYFYAVAVVGVVMVLIGAITMLITVRAMFLPEEFNGPDADGILHGAVVALIGLALLWPHLRSARRREGVTATVASWGASLYYHLVAFVALMVVVVGSQIALHPLVEWATSDCGTAAAPGAVAYDLVCSFPPTVVDGLIVMLVAGPVWWWHLRQGRRLAAPEHG